MSAGARPLTLDIFSDPICPWCYIGLKRLDEALAEVAVPVETRCRCFMLNPDMPAKGMDRRAYLERKFGGPEGANRVYGAIEKAAKAAGLQVNFDKITRTPSTLKAHQALREAHEHGGADSYIRALFGAYFEDGRDIGEAAVLADLWVACDLPEGALDTVFAEQRHQEAVMAEQNEARVRGVSGVPFFVINGAYALSGAQDKSVFHRVFELAQQNEAA